MNEQFALEAGPRVLQCVREFSNCFPEVEHFIVPAKRQVPGEGWGIISEWISRAQLHDRYIFWLVVAIEVKNDGSIATTEQPQVYVVECSAVEKTSEEVDGPKWSLSFGQLEADDWQELVKLNGDFNAASLELITAQPVQRFDTFWNDTRPHTAPPTADAIALKAPLRFLFR